MSPRPKPAPGLPAPWLCRRCGRALWWMSPHLPDGPVLVDVRGRERCAPYYRHRSRRHELPRIEWARGNVSDFDKRTR